MEMFDKLDKPICKAISDLTFSTSFIKYIKKRNVTGTKISKGHRVNRMDCKKEIIDQKLIQLIAYVEKLYIQQQKGFLSQQNIGNFKVLPANNHYGFLIDGYYYFYPGFLKTTKVRSPLTCPICEAEGVSLHWDHVIPKSLYPLFSLVPVNLVPICSACNEHKQQKFDFQNQLPFHPLFEDIPTKTLIHIDIDHAQIKQRLGKGLNIKYDPPLNNLVVLYNLNELITIRVQNRLKQFVQSLINSKCPLAVQKQFDPNNNHGAIPDVQWVTDDYIFKLPVNDLMFLKSKAFKDFLNIY